MRPVQRSDEPDFHLTPPKSETSDAHPKASRTTTAVLLAIGLALVVPASIGAFVAKMNGHPMADPWGAWFASAGFYGIFVGTMFRASPAPWVERSRVPLMVASAGGLVYCVGRVIAFYAFGYP
jgi:hypothetical protein